MGSDVTGGGELGLKKRKGMGWGGTKVERSCEGCVTGEVLGENTSEGEGYWDVVIVEMPFGGLRMEVPEALLRSEVEMGSLGLNADGESPSVVNITGGWGAGTGLEDCGSCDGVGERVLGPVEGCTEGELTEELGLVTLASLENLDWLFRPTIS